MKDQVRRGFTIVDMAGTVLGATLVLTTALAFVARGPDGEDAKVEQSPKQVALDKRLKDATHIRGIHQSLVLFAQNNKDSFPRPSVLDNSGDTVAGSRESKDTTANIYSMLVYQNFLTPELLVSPVETNPTIEASTSYAYTDPPKAINPKKALWDPAFSADFTVTGKGNTSYAHAMPFGERLNGPWTNSFNSRDAVVSNRGPEIKSVEYNEENTKATMTLASPKSRTLHFFDAGCDPRQEGDPVLWRGNIAYNDNHVDFVASKYGEGQTVTEADVGSFKFAEDRKRPDLLFFNEDPNPKDDNQFLGIFTSAGKSRSDWKAIWD